MSNEVLFLETFNLAPCSLERGQLAKAFCLARQEYPQIVPNRTNTHNNSEYSDYHGIITQVMPALVKHSLAFWQFTTLINKEIVLVSELCHGESGQFIRGFFPMIISLDEKTQTGKQRNIDQEIGKTWTYMRRYAAVSLLCITIDKDSDDDDGQQNAKMNQSTQHVKVPSQNVYQKKTPVVEPPKESLKEIVKAVLDEEHVYISNDQHDILQKKLQAYPDIAKGALKYYKIEHLKHVPRTQFDECLSRIEIVIKRKESIQVEGE